MLNQIILVGRVFDIRNKEDEQEIVLKVQRLLKEGNEKEYDYIKVSVLSKSMQENVSNYLKKDNIVGVRGKLQASEDENIKIIAERLSFLS